LYAAAESVEVKGFDLGGTDTLVLLLLLLLLLLLCRLG
jgi:hypothetical protein